MIFEQRLKEVKKCTQQILGEGSVTGCGNSQCKGPEVGVFSRKSKEASVAQGKWVTGRMAMNKVREIMGARLWGAFRTLVRTLALPLPDVEAMAGF